MRNSLRHPLFHDARNSPAAEAAPRLRLPAALLILTLNAVLVRVAWVQSQLPDDYLQALAVTTTEEELLTARNGQILADTTVLARDEDQWALQIHYRWLEQQPESTWLKQQLRQRLSREERRDAVLVRSTEQKILNERHLMLQAVASATGVSSEEIEARRKQIEARVRGIIDRVNRPEQVAADAAADEAEDADSSGLLLLRLAAAIRSALTTAPRRSAAERIFVREEETWHQLLPEISARAAAVISEHPERFPGVRVQAHSRRVYPHPDFAVHVVGARTRPDAASAVQSTVTAADPADKPQQPATVGRFGVEKSYDAVLSGMPGVRRVVRDRRQRIISSEILRQPVAGRDVLLTLDPELQQLAEQLLAESLGDTERRLLPAPEDPLESADPDAPPEPELTPVGGSVVVMEADSGRLLALASAPEFDLTLFTHGSQTAWEAANSDTRRPFVSRFHAMAIPPGSVWKIATAISALETGTCTPQMEIVCRGFLQNPDEHRCLIFRAWGVGHGPVNLRGALAQSCNVWFFNAAQQMGIEPQATWADRLEFGRRTGVDLPFERSGTLPARPPANATETVRRRFAREALGFSIGQSRLTTTPLQIARLLAVVANRGWLVVPHVVSDEGAARHLKDAALTPWNSTRVRIPGLSVATLQAIHEGLVDGVSSPAGTAYRTVHLGGLSAAGKTGTAEAGAGRADHAWFAGYFPAENPKYVVVVALEHGGSGARAAGPVARELFKLLQARLKTEQLQTN
ncbi:MAG: penicillin-binding transpeptidase domain-containing protein [Planctomyces sp.]